MKSAAASQALSLSSAVLLPPQGTSGLTLPVYGQKFLPVPAAHTSMIYCPTFTTRLGLR